MVFNKSYIGQLTKLILSSSMFDEYTMFIQNKCICFYCQTHYVRSRSIAMHVSPSLTHQPFCV